MSAMGLSRLMPYIAMAILALVYFASVADAKPKSKSYYEILGVEQDCDAKDIKRAYHKLALKFHPDKQPDFNDKKKLEAKFAAITKAYDILSDATKRERYNKLLSFGQTEYDEERYKEEDMRKEQEAAAAAAAAQAATQRRQQKPAEGEPENAETKPTKQQFVSEDTANLIRKVAAAIIVVLGGAAGWYLFTQSKSYQKMNAPTKEQIALEKKQEIKQMYTEFKEEYQRQVELEAQREEMARKRRETILRKMAERALADQRTQEQIEADDKALEERVTKMMEEMQKVDETKVTHWEGDDELEKMIDAAVLAEAQEAEKSKGGKKSAQKKKAPAKSVEEAPVVTPAVVEQPQTQVSRISVEEIDDDDTNTQENHQLGQSKAFCDVCKVGFKTEAQLSNHEKSKKHLKNVRDVSRSLKTWQQGKEKGAAGPKAVRRRDEELEIELRESEEILKDSHVPSASAKKENEKAGKKMAKKDAKNSDTDEEDDQSSSVSKNMFELLGDE